MLIYDVQMKCLYSVVNSVDVVCRVSWVSFGQGRFCRVQLYEVLLPTFFFFFAVFFPFCVCAVFFAFILLSIVGIHGYAICCANEGFI